MTVAGLPLQRRCLRGTYTRKIDAAGTIADGDSDALETPVDPREAAHDDAAIDSTGRQRRWIVLCTVGAALISVVMRVARLSDVPGELYGDIAIVREYVDSIRGGSWPINFVLSSGPLYHYAIVPIVFVVGRDFTGLKWASVVVSLAALAGTYALARELRDRRLAATSLFIAGVSSWLLIFSRLGNSTIMVPTLATLALVFTVRSATRPQWWNPVLAAAIGCAGLFEYPQTFVLAPVMLVTLVALVLSRTGARWREVIVFSLTTVVGLVVFLVAERNHIDELLHGYVGGKIHTDSVLSVLWRNIRNSALAFNVRGDATFRSNPARLPHLDPVSGLLLLAGIGSWLRPAQRRWAPALLVPFVLLQLPAVLVLERPEEVPSASRTLAVAPIAYILVATGLWWLLDLIRRSRVARGSAAAAVLLVVLVLNADRYFGAYADGLPNHNTPFGRIIADYLQTLPSDTHAFTAGCCWGDHGQPEPKGITYLDAGRVATGLVELQPDFLDCETLAGLPRPAVIVWPPTRPLPSDLLDDCAASVQRVVHVENGVPVFSSARLAAAGP